MTGRRSLRFVVLVVLLPLLVAAYFTLRRSWHRTVEERRTPPTTISDTETGSGNASATPTEPGTAAPPQEKPLKIVGWRFVEDFPEEIALFESVFWEPRDTTTLRRLIRQPSFARDKTVLEIGTGSGLLSLCCLKAGARRVVATDVNSAAVANAAYNADLLGIADRLETRLVSLKQTGAFAVVEDTEKFDLIISNPPWENQKPVSIDQYALYDEGFQLLRSILDDLPKHLRPGGRAYLAYGCVSAVRQCQRLATGLELSVQILDDRDLDELPEVFLPAMVIQVTPRPPGGLPN
jgi:SAM-dependent methyltransferase